MTFAALVAERRGAPPPFLDRRFDAAGRALPDAGSTIIGHVAPGPVRDALVAVRDRLAGAAAGDCFAWLPPSSYHMTLYDGLLHNRRIAGFWPAALAPDAAPDAADAFMIERFRRVPPPEPDRFAMKPIAVEPAPGGAGLWLRLEPDTAAEAARIRRFRDACAAAVGLENRPGHATYVFHITLAYGIAWPDDGSAAQFEAALVAANAALSQALAMVEIGPPEICCFKDMTAFEVQAVLSSAGSRAGAP